MIDRLNVLLRIELAAVAGYQRALAALRRRAIADGDQILRFASEHQRTVAALQQSVQARGGAPLLEAEPWEGLGVAVLTQDSTPELMERKEFMAALLSAERRGLSEYETALASLDEDARALVELELIPRQKKHVESLSALLVHLA